MIYFQLSQTKSLKKGDASKLAYYMKEILQSMKPVLQPQTQNKHLAKQIQTTFKGYSKDDEKKILSIAEGL